jgi:hypothetical protein
VWGIGNRSRDSGGRHDHGRDRGIPQRRARTNATTERWQKLLISKLASTLGWPDLYYDTYPNPKFNIWHFPDDKKGASRWRAIPASRDVVFCADVAPVRREDILTLNR